MEFGNNAEKEFSPISRAAGCVSGEQRQADESDADAGTVRSNEPALLEPPLPAEPGRQFYGLTEAAGLANAGDGNYGMGVAVGDYDNDGFPNLYVTSYGHNVLYHNDGDGTFTDVTARAGVREGGRFLRDFSIMTTTGSSICS